MHIGEPEVAALVGKGEAEVVHAHQVQDRGIEIMHVHLLLGRDDVVRVVVGGSPCEARLHALPGHEHCEAPWVVVTAVVGLGQGSLRIDCAAKLPSPDHKRLV